MRFKSAVFSSLRINVHVLMRCGSLRRIVNFEVTYLMHICSLSQCCTDLDRDKIQNMTLYVRSWGSLVLVVNVRLA